MCTAVSSLDLYGLQAYDVVIYDRHNPFFVLVALGPWLIFLPPVFLRALSMPLQALVFMLSGLVMMWRLLKKLLWMM